MLFRLGFKAIRLRDIVLSSVDITQPMVAIGEKEMGLSCQLGIAAEASDPHEEPGGQHVRGQLPPRAEVRVRHVMLPRHCMLAPSAMPTAFTCHVINHRFRPILTD